MSRYLINESPLVVLPSLAKEIGLNEAIVLQQIQYWINAPAGGKNIDGVKWIWNSVSEWQAQFPFWSSDTIKRTLGKLKERGLIRVSQFNKATWDRTNFYTIDYSTLSTIVESTDRGKLHQSVGANCTHLDEGKLHHSTNTDTTTDTNVRFSAFWKLYPKKKDKKKAGVAFGRLTKGNMDKAIKHLKTYPYNGTEPRFTPLPTTYIHGERWDDEVSTSNGKSMGAWE